MPRLISLALASTLAFAAASAPAFAREEQIRSQIVRYGDLNLKADEDADVLLARIDNAAENVCGDTPNRVQLSERREIATCTRGSTQVAIAEVDHPNVTAEYYGYAPQIVIDETDTVKDK